MMTNDLVSDRPIVFTAQSKQYFYCCDAVCEYVFNRGGVPLNPFRVFGYFLGDRVPRDAVRRGNNNLIRICDELWVFGLSIADGVMFEIEYAAALGKQVRLHTIDNDAKAIRECKSTELTFENQLRQKAAHELRRLGLNLKPTEYLRLRVLGEQFDQRRLFDMPRDS